MIAVKGGILLSLCFLDILALKLFKLISFFGFFGSCSASCSWTNALAMSEHALKYRSFSGGRFSFGFFCCLALIVKVSVAIFINPFDPKIKRCGGYCCWCFGGVPLLESQNILGRTAVPRLSETYARNPGSRTELEKGERPSTHIFKFSIPFFLTSIVSDKMQAFSRCARPALQAAIRRQGYSTSTSAYASTAENLRITKETRVIYQGFTGKQGTYVVMVVEQ